MLRIRIDSENGQLGSYTSNNLSICRTLFAPGQRISGKVHLDLDKDEEVPKVLIEFRGRIKSSITTGSGNNRRTRRFEYIMFSFQKILFDGQDFKLRATNYEWPFSFTFPERFTMRNDPFDHSPRFTVGDQLLPPSCSDINGSRANGSISYQLLARVPRTFLDWKFETYLRFTPVRREALPHSMHVPKRQTETEQKKKFRFDAVGPRPLTTKESLSDKFRSHPDTKVVNFRTLISAPTVVVIGKPYPLLVTLKSDSEEEIIPEFNIYQVEAHFKAFTEVRVDGTFGDRQGGTETTIPLVTTKEGLKIALPIDETVTVTGVFPPGDYAPPTFSTISIWRSYRLTVHLRIQCLDDLYKVSCKWPQVLLLPAKMGNGVEEAAELIRSGHFQVPDAVPDYGEVIASDVPGIAADVAPPTYKEAQAS